MKRPQYPKISVSWPDDDLLERAKAAALLEERSLSQWIVRAVREYLDRHYPDLSSSSLEKVEAERQKILKKAYAEATAGRHANRVPVTGKGAAVH